MSGITIAILDTYYPELLASLYREAPGLEGQSHIAQSHALLDANFGTSDYYSRHLNALGCQAVDLIANALPLQRAWARENDYPVTGFDLSIDCRLARLPLIGRFLSRVPGLIRVVAEQVRRMRPDVLYCQDMTFLPPPILRALRARTRLIVGQIASPVPAGEYVRSFDLILTSFPHFVPRFRAMGVDTQYFRIGFDPRVLECLGAVKRDLPVTFVGGIASGHSGRARLLDELARVTPIEMFGYGYSRLPSESLVRSRYHGPVWGIEMYRTLARSRITLNHHSDVAENHANSMRLYEATGVGTLLLTDRKDNLGDLFEVNREVVTYDSAADAAARIQHLLARPEEADVIARAGQARTLREHTYEHRMKELLPILTTGLAKTRHA